MALNIKQDARAVDVKVLRDALQRQTDSFGVFFDMDRCFEISAILQLQMRDLDIKAKHLVGNPRFTFDNKSSVIKTLMDMGVTKMTFDRLGDKYTAAIRETILRNTSYSDEVHKLVELSNEYVSCKRNKGNIENFAIRGEYTSMLSKDKRRMCIGHPEWSILNTTRLAAKNPGIQGIPRTMGDIITEPAGYHLLRCDSGQIEPRINVSAFLLDEVLKMLIIYYNDAYFGFLHYCLMTNEELAALYRNLNDFKPIEITDKIKAERQNIKRLTNAGSYGSSNLDGINPNLAAAYDKRIVHHPNRIALERKVRDDVKHGKTTFYAFFGTPVTPQETEKYKQNDDGWEDHVIRCGINNPIQTTAAELMLFSVSRALELLRQLKDSHICYYKHDEACFYISDEDMGKPEVKELEDITAYNVEGWIPIEAEPVWGVKKATYPSYL